MYSLYNCTAEKRLQSGQIALSSNRGKVFCEIPGDRVGGSHSELDVWERLTRVLTHLWISWVSCGAPTRCDLALPVSCAGLTMLYSGRWLAQHPGSWVGIIWHPWRLSGHRLVPTGAERASYGTRGGWMGISWHRWWLSRHCPVPMAAERASLVTSCLYVCVCNSCVHVCTQWAKFCKQTAAALLSDLCLDVSDCTAKIIACHH